MRFVFKEVTPNNEKKVAVFRSEDQSCELFITGDNSADFSQFKPRQTYITITEAVEETTTKAEV